MSTQGARAMVLAAGLGHRMRPLTLRNTQAIDRSGRQVASSIMVSKRSRAAKIETAVVNVHYLPEQVEAWAHAAKAAAARFSSATSVRNSSIRAAALPRRLPLLGEATLLRAQQRFLLVRIGRAGAIAHARRPGTTQSWIACCLSVRSSAAWALTGMAIFRSMREARWCASARTMTILSSILAAILSIPASSREPRPAHSR